MKKMPAFLASILVLSVYAAPAQALMACIGIRRMMLERLLEDNFTITVSFGLILMASTIMWLSEESKGRDANPVGLASFIVITGICAASLVFMVRLTTRADEYGYGMAFAVILISVILKIALMSKRPRAARAIPAMLLMYLTLAFVLFQNQYSECG